MKNKIVGIVVLMLVATSVVSATNINVKINNNVSVNSEPYEPGLFDWWGVDQKQTHQYGTGMTLTPPETNAQSFTPTKDKLTAVSLYIFKAGTPPEPVQITVSIRDNLTGSNLTTKTIDTSVVTIKSSGTWVLFDFEDISLSPENTYYMVCIGTAGDATNAYVWLFADNDTYNRGEPWYKATENYPWMKNHMAGDFCFKTYFRKPLDVSSAPQTIPSTSLTGMKMIDTPVTAVESFQNSEIDTTIPSISEASMTGDWTQTQKLLASDGTAGDCFGNLVAMDGDYTVIGANQDNLSGSAYVFVRTGDNWTQQAKLHPSDGAIGDLFGSPAISGDTVLIGAALDDDNGTDSGSAYIFVRTGSTWTQQAKLRPLDGAASDHFGGLVALFGDTALIGACLDDDLGTDSGSAYVFTRTGTTWTQTQKILAPDGQTGDYFGYTSYLDGDTAIIAAPLDDDKGVNTGSAYVFIKSGTSWIQQQKLTASDSILNDQFGQSVALDGDTALIGAPGYGPGSTQIGAAYVFIRYGVTWTERAKLTASDAQTLDQFSAYAVALDSTTAIVGSPGDDVVGSNSGSAYVFSTPDGINWMEQQKLIPSDGASTDEFSSVALDGNSAIITSWHDDDNGANSGSAYVFTKKGLTFSISGGIGVKATIANEATTDANDIPWQIHVEGGILGMINKTVNGTVDVPAGETVTVKTGILLGFGAISIIAKVADEEQTATGTQIIIFSMVPKK